MSIGLNTKVKGHGLNAASSYGAPLDLTVAANRVVHSRFGAAAADLRRVDVAFDVAGGGDVVVEIVRDPEGAAAPPGPAVVTEILRQTLVAQQYIHFVTDDPIEDDEEIRVTTTRATGSWEVKVLSMVGPRSK